MIILYKVPMYALDGLRAFVSSFIPHFFFFSEEDGRTGRFFGMKGEGFF